MEESELLLAGPAESLLLFLGGVGGSELLLFSSFLVAMLSSELLFFSRREGSELLFLTGMGGFGLQS
ncbi:hypothetical protein SLE2022_238470 [Rubroshorea leprosula]